MFGAGVTQNLWNRLRALPTNSKKHGSTTMCRSRRGRGNRAQLSEWKSWVDANQRTRVRLSYNANQSFYQRTSRLPGPLRRKLGIRDGDPLDANIEAGRIVLTPRKHRPHRVKIVTDSTTGLPVLSADPDAPVLSSKEVQEILANFP